MNVVSRTFGPKKLGVIYIVSICVLHGVHIP